MPNPVKPIPDNYHSITPNLVCRNAVQAIDYYKTVFGATELMRMPGPDGKIMHAELKIGDSIFFLAEPMARTPAPAPGPGTSNPMSIHLYVEDADSVFSRAVAAGARVDMPL
jgi:PhnB protein